MAEGSAEEEQSSTAAPASPPADLRTLNTQLSPPYHYQSHLVPPLQHLQHPNMLATAVPPRHSHSMLSHQGKTDAELDAPCDVPLNLKSEVLQQCDEHLAIRWWADLQAQPASASSTDSDRSSVGSPELVAAATGSLHEHQIMMDEMKNSRKNSPSPENLHLARRAAMAQAQLNGMMADTVTLQNLQNLAHIRNLPQVASLAAGLQGLTNNQLINTPLNLTVSSSANESSCSGRTVPTASNTTTAPHLLPPSTTSMTTLPQLLSQPQPVAMPQFILASGQLVQGIQGAQLLIPTSQGIVTQTILTMPVSLVTNNQMVNLALNSGQVVSTTVANLQSIPQPQNVLNTSPSNGEFTVPTSPSLATGLGISPAALPHLLNNSSASQQLLNAMQPQQLLQAAQPQQQGHRHSSHMNHYTPTEKHHRERPEQSSPLNESVASAASALNRLAASNGEITITTTHAPSGAGVKASPSSMHNPVKEEEDLNDSSNQVISNDATNINLDEIKEFAKVFKFRRLSLGLTQTQVGQALSVTEGPAYSQSAICSALATQMYASQIASQQQATFEKLDITPKSAQKIKPVLERWMKTAEERQNNGLQLTDLIGVETSKKRKRRTSFTPQALEMLNAHFNRNTHPNGNEITNLAQCLGYDREVIRIWFCNKRQSQKNADRMLAKDVK
ncbi:PREDICTED: LOW QUALITY PROTEIN: POU domain, class 6, transcription factor 2 [Eufriesea mexicana]|uniref:LOW QUALITY PROTEIN: POU domain, class 6, transcription factor 2 n=1 Tax=Eufriesea mexicana TaxID=516756 RepID=UPI00083BC8D2|nr:PREDICTED: LOW QUALITY PROTEIN: POU domain, class 6, transcription factor 2 [Eufriesea mexicana]